MASQPHLDSDLDSFNHQQWAFRTVDALDKNLERGSTANSSSLFPISMLLSSRLLFGSWPLLAMSNHHCISADVVWDCEMEAGCHCGHDFVNSGKDPDIG